MSRYFKEHIGHVGEKNAAYIARRKAYSAVSYLRFYVAIMLIKGDYWHAGLNLELEIAQCGTKSHGLKVILDERLDDAP